MAQRIQQRRAAMHARADLEQMSNLHLIGERDRVALRPEQASIPPGHPWNRIPMIGGGVAILGAVICAILGAGNPKAVDVLGFVARQVWRLNH